MLQRMFQLLQRHGIVMYLCIYIALLAVHTNQKLFQCERAREKTLERIPNILKYVTITLP